MYPNVRIYHFTVDRNQNDHIQFRYHLRSGETTETKYGIDALTVAGWNHEIIDEAKCLCL